MGGVRRIVVLLGPAPLEAMIDRWVDAEGAHMATTSLPSVGNEAGSPGVSSQLTHHFSNFQCRMMRQRSPPSGLTKPRLPV